MNSFKRLVLECSQELVSLSLVKATSGNVSLRLSNSFLITPSGYPLHSLTEDLIVEINSCGHALEEKTGPFGFLKPSMETQLHLALYHAHPKAKAVVHAHPLYATIIGTYLPLKPLTYEAKAFIDPIDYIPPLQPGSKELAAYVGRTTAQVIVLKNHGVVVWGDNFQECIFKMQVMEENAKQTYIGKTMGILPQ